mmetsp:Transcript_1889/g.4943  ORF Transcript_1889/g.4943 Transcript_1889/m.4943 type:complete len:216 (+) Transcript_1889:845-1492(+)
MARIEDVFPWNPSSHAQFLGLAPRHLLFGVVNVPPSRIQRQLHLALALRESLFLLARQLTDAVPTGAAVPVVVSLQILVRQRVPTSVALLSERFARPVLVRHRHPLVEDVAVAVEQALLLGYLVEVREDAAFQVVDGSVPRNELHRGVGRLLASNAPGAKHGNFFLFLHIVLLLLLLLFLFIFCRFRRRFLFRAVSRRLFRKRIFHGNNSRDSKA